MIGLSKDSFCLKITKIFYLHLLKVNATLEMISMTSSKEKASSILRKLHLSSNSRVGKGLIIQLNGPPGVGKTLTAEAGMYRSGRDRILC